MSDEYDGLYEQLRQKLDSIGFGYSKTESGAEYTFLRRFITPDQAEYVIGLPAGQYFTVAQAAQVMGRPEDEVAAALAAMAAAGVIFRRRNAAGAPEYHLVPVAHGVFEFQVNHVEPEWSGAMTQHYLQGWGKTFYGGGSQPFDIAFERVMPAKEAVAPGELLDVDDWELCLARARRISVADCICRKREVVRGYPCDHPMEACLAFDDFADFYIENGMGREISLDEARGIVRTCLKQGLVINASNSLEPETMCLCCGDGCGVLGAIKYLPGPAVQKAGNYVVVRDAEKCIEPKCPHNCAKRCPVRAFQSKDGVLKFRPTQCIGCGACVTGCPGKALVLHRKPDGQIQDRFPTLFDTYDNIMVQRLSGPADV